MKYNDSDIGLTALIDTMVDGVIIIDATGIITRINPAALTMFGYEPKEVIGKNIKLLMPPPYQDEHDGYLRTYHRTGRKKIIGVGRDVKGIRKDESVFPLELSVGETQANGEKYFIGIIRDLTRREREKREFEQLQEEHFHLSRSAAMNEMGSAIAHELNQPLAATSNYLETIRILLNRGVMDPKKLDDILQKAIEQTQRTSGVVDKLRNHMSGLALPRESLDLAKLIPLTIRIAQAPYDQKLTITQDIPEGLPLVFGNESQLQMVIVQILRNALKALGKYPEASINLTILHDQKAGELVLSIADNGQGLTEKDIQTLFVPLGGDENSAGGFGLSICHSIITRHEGRIWAEPNKPKGTVFSFALPVL